jgi:hypothetical protein
LVDSRTQPGANNLRSTLAGVGLKVGCTVCSVPHAIGQHIGCAAYRDSSKATRQPGAGIQGLLRLPSKGYDQQCGFTTRRALQRQRRLRIGRISISSNCHQQHFCSRWDGDCLQTERIHTEHPHSWQTSCWYTCCWQVVAQANCDYCHVHDAHHARGSVKHRSQVCTFEHLGQGSHSLWWRANPTRTAIHVVEGANS